MVLFEEVDWVLDASAIWPHLALHLRLRARGSANPRYCRSDSQERGSLFQGIYGCQ